MALRNIPPATEQIRKAAGITLVNSKELYPAHHTAVDAGLPMLVVKNEHAHLVVALQGAHIMAFKATNKPEMLWVSPKTLLEAGKPIRGGIPLCLPWFGPGPDAKSMHGFARTQEWTLTTAETLKCGATRLVLELSGESITELWPHAFHFMMEIIAGTELKLKLKVKNLGHSEAPLAFAFHTYFAVPDVAKARVAGLDGTTYIDKTDQMARKVQSGAVTISAMTDRVYLNVPQEQKITSGTADIAINSEAKAAVVWNAWDNDKNIPDLGEGNHKGYLCVERGDVADHALALPPGAQYEIWMTLAN